MVLFYGLTLSFWLEVNHTSRGGRQLAQLIADRNFHTEATDGMNCVWFFGYLVQPDLCCIYLLSRPMVLRVVFEMFSQQLL